MAHVDCVNNFENDPKVALGNKDESESGPPSKKLRQARLPFKPLEQKSQIVSPQGPKKRKLSDGESPSAKLHKNHKQERQPSGENKPLTTNCIVDHDPEVSSSSEAENIPVGNSSRIRNTLERFVRKCPQEEISSTNDCIDLVEKNDSTGNDAEGQEKTDDTEKDLKNDLEKNPANPENLNKSDKGPSNDEHKDLIVNSEDAFVSCTEEKEGNEKDSEIIPLKDDSETQPRNQQKVTADVSADKEKCTSLDITKETRDSSMDEEDVSSSQDVNLETPAKIKQSDDSAPQTPKVNPIISASPTSTPGEITACPKTPSVDSPSSCSDGTPKSGKKGVRSKLSAAKMKEKEALRQKIKEEKEKKLEEKRLKKEEERLEREEKKKEREEAKALKEKQREEEKERKEKERQEKLLLKEEEKKKKQEQTEAKLEEKRKKDEELKLKKEEKLKEEEEKVKKASKTKQAFQSFFINKQRVSPVSKVNETKSLFMPFEVKKDMKLAPSCPRKQLDIEAAATLDQLSFKQVSNASDSLLYVEELRTGKLQPKKFRAVDRKKNKVDDDVMLVHDSEVVKKVTYHCKLLQFHTNYRPPYYGTWRKKSNVISPRNPWKQDKDLFDYEVESDDEWEEEEPGESLSGSEGEEEEEGADGEEEDDWMVPHGYLSDDEGCQADEDVSPEMMKAARQAKLESWESELKRQTKAALPIIIGCVWEQALHSLQKQVQETMDSYQAVCLSADPIPTTYSGANNSKLDSSPSDKNIGTPKNGMRKPVPEEAMPDLIRLVHGNLAGIKKLIKKFRTFWGQKISGEAIPSTPTESKMEVDTPDMKDEDAPNDKAAMDTSEITEDVNAYCISKRQLELKISAIAVREKRAAYKKVCWYVHDNILEQYKLTDLPVPNIHESDSEPPKPKCEEQTTPTTSLKTPKVSITQFARPMSPSEIAAQHAAVAAKQAAEATARLAALEAASKQAALEAAAKQQAMEAAMRQAAAVNAAQLGSMQVIPGTSFTSPQQKTHAIYTSPSHANFNKAMSPRVVLPGGSPLTAKASPENQRKRIVPTMLSPLSQKSLQSPPVAKSESQMKRVPTMISPSNPQKKMTPPGIPGDNQQKRIVPTMLSPQHSKTAMKTDLPFNTVNTIKPSVRPVNKPNVESPGQTKPNNALSAHSKSSVRPMVKIRSSPAGPNKTKQVFRPVVEGRDLENAIVID
ncbi:chromatin assembly factor 1 subunit A-B-like [Ylistrum balloti]|uniref:chromatin assembly factor 1 subunit A-B-like n=1 Tax=Ylistrum balloti TaxID=509963 RepID=UPI0029058058|nr:chromatin assembly factor 1 subunit A-B-like [Ylistrum balloti]